MSGSFDQTQLRQFFTYRCAAVALHAMRIGHAEIVRRTDHDAIAVQQTRAFVNLLAVQQRLELGAQWLDVQIAALVLDDTVERYSD